MRSRRRRWLGSAAASLVAAGTVGALALPGAGTAQPPVNWPSYLMGSEHSSYNAAATTITTANATSLSEAWSFAPGGSGGNDFYSSPTVYDGNVYIGSDNGTFYDLSESTGSVVWSYVTAQQPPLTCTSRFEPQGFVATATVAPDPTSGDPTVYEAAPDGYLYAWNASDGTLLWRSVIAIPSTTVNNYFDWSSPTVVNGKIYVGVASACDMPLVHGGENVYDQASGQLLASFQTNGNRDLGGDIWSSTLVTSDGDVYVSTGNQQKRKAVERSDSIIRLDPDTLQMDDIFTVPPRQRVKNGDFGSSPVVWNAEVNGVPTELVGACNKNGRFYALRASDLAAGPVWTDKLGSSPQKAGYLTICSSSAVWDQDTSQLFLSGNYTKIDDTTYKGSVQEVDPSTGKPIWQTGLPGAVLGTPTLDGSGVLAVETCDFSGAPNAVYLVDASDGTILATVSSDDEPVFAQPTFADNYLFVATVGEGLHTYEISTTSSTAHSSHAR